jgi:hypothetical protein
MKLRCLRGSLGFVGDRETVSRGDIFEVPETQARILIAERDAEEVVEEPKTALEETPKEEPQESSKQTQRKRRK